MDPKITQEILDDLIPSLESLETRSAAVLEFLKSEGIATDEKLAPYFDKAATASNVRWLGVRVRIERLLSAAEKESADKKADEDKKSADSRSPSNQGRESESGEKPAEVSQLKSEPDKKSTSRSQIPTDSEDNGPRANAKDEEENSHSRRESRRRKLHDPPATNADKWRPGRRQPISSGGKSSRRKK